MTRGARHSKHRHRRKRTIRRWPRRILLAVNVVVALCLVSAGTVYGYVKTKIGSIQTLAAPHLAAPVAHAGGLSPENILLIGNQSRAGLGTDIYGSPTVLSGSLSDVIMVLHLDPAKRSASILSIPRDLFVPQPAGSPVGAYQKIDAALNDGAKGPDNLIQTIQSDLGIPINHFIELNFNGFQGTVNALGGINMNFPERVYDFMSNFDINQTGCQHLNGTQALALVRSRHLQYDPPGVSPDNHDAWPYDPESDLSRIVRDHAFLRVLASTAESQGLSNPIKANSFIDGIINQITVDRGLRDQLVSLATHYHGLNPATAPQTTLPVNQVGNGNGYSYAGYAVGDVEFPNQPLDNQVIAAWDGQALPPPSTPAAVEVENVTDSYNLGTTTASALAADGLSVTNVTHGTVAASTSPTFVDYATGGLAQGLSVLKDFGGAVMLELDPSLATGTVHVKVGSAGSVLGPGGSPVSSTESGSSTTSSSSTSGDNTIDPMPSSAADKIAPWDPRPC